MNTNDTATNNGLDSILPIRAVSGGERGNKEAGKKHDYLLPKAAAMALFGEVFDKEVERSNPENAKSGGAVAQFLHSYGATADKQEKSGINPFPEEVDEKDEAGRHTGRKAPGTFTGENMELWLEVMEFKAPRTGGTRKTAEEVTIEAILTTLTVPGVTWEMLAPVYPAITQEKIDAYKAKVAAKVEE